MFVLSSDKRLARRGQKAMASQDWGAAVSAFRSFLLRNPEDWRVLEQLGHALKQSGSKVEAANCYCAALQLADEPNEIGVHLGHVLKDLDRPEEATEAFLTLPGNLEALREAGLLGRGDAAREQMAKSIPRAPRADWIEIGDLLSYHQSHARPSGIQRVQLEIASEILRQEAEIRLLALLPGGIPAEVSPEAFSRLYEAIAGDDPGFVLELTRRTIQQASPVVPMAGSTIFTLGGFWADPGFNGSLHWLKSIGCYIASMVHDLIPLSYPEFSNLSNKELFRRRFDDLAKIADVLVAISPQTEADICRNAPREVRIKLMPLAHSKISAPLHDDCEGWLLEKGITKPFVLCVGTLEPRKNHDLLFRVWSSVLDQGAETPQLVLAGRDGWGVSDLLGRLRATDNLGGQIVRVGPASDRDLATLYKTCLFSVFPSYAEGWGLPVGESMCLGKVVVASSAIADAPIEQNLKFDPDDTVGAEHILAQLWNSPESLLAAELRLQESFQARSWKDVAVDAAKILESLRDEA